MRKGKTLEEIKNEIDILSNGAVEMISNEYIDRDTILTLKCSCGNIYEQSFKNFKRGTTKCPICIQNQMRVYNHASLIRTVFATGTVLLITIVQ